MKKKHLKAVKKQEQDVRAKRAVGIWKRRTWKRGLGRMGSGVVTTVTAPVTRAGSENEDEDEDEEDDDFDGNGEETMRPIRRRSEGLTVDVCTTLPISKIPKTLTIHRLITPLTQHSFLPHLLHP